MCETVNGKSRLVHKLLGTKVAVQQSLLPLLLSVIVLLSSKCVYCGMFLFAYDDTFSHWWLSATDHDHAVVEDDAVVEDGVRQQHLLLALAVDLGEVRVSLEMEFQVAPQVLQICKPEHLKFVNWFENFNL